MQTGQPANLRNCRWSSPASPGVATGVPVTSVARSAGAVVPVVGGLEVWAPARGRTGGGVRISDGGETERFAVRWEGDVVRVAAEDGTAVQAGVTVRGL